MFKKKLLSQESIDYIAYKSVQAIYRVLTTTQEFTEPSSVIAMKTAYKINNSSILSWFKEEFVNNKINPTEEERKEAIESIGNLRLQQAYNNYTEWCKETNKQSLARPNFEEELKNQFGIRWGGDEN
jgi:phage/plasmid-associated DNA primase